MSATFSVAEREPAAAGLKLTETVQMEPAARVAGGTGQVVVSEKDLGLLATNTAARMATGCALLPAFFTETVCAALAVPTAGLMKVRLVGDRVTAWAPTAALHAFARSVAFTEPNPVARS